MLRLFSGLFSGRPVGYLLLTLAGLLGAALLLGRAPVRTRAGRTALRSVRREHTHLAPASAPAYATYGAAGAAMGVALYGTASLWALDPGFAEQAEIQRQAISGTGGWTGGSDGSSGGGGDSSGGDGGSSCGAVEAAGAGAAAGAADDRPVRRRHRLAPGDRRLRGRAARPALRRGGRRVGARRPGRSRPAWRSCGNAA